MRRFRIIIIGLPLLLLAGFGLLKHGILAKHRATQAQRFVASAMQGDLTDVKALLAEGIDPDVKIKFGGHPLGSWDGTALIAAVWGGHADVVRLLLSKGASVDLSGGGDVAGVVGVHFRTGR